MLVRSSRFLFRFGGDFLQRRGLSSGSRIGILGIYEDSSSSFLDGATQALPIIRSALWSESGNEFAETGFAVLGSGEKCVFEDYGDMCNASFESIMSRLKTMLDAHHKPMILGGDHSISYPVIKSLMNWRINNLKHPEFAILHLDAHPNVSDETGSKRCSHACTFVKILEPNEGEPIARVSLAQIGIRAASTQEREQMARFNIKAIEMRYFNRFKEDLRHSLSELLPEPLTDKLDVYISFDIDCLDPAFAPGVSHYEPGGLTTREVLDILHALPEYVRIIGADCVEFNPARDINGITAMVSAKICKELMTLMLKDPSSDEVHFEE